MSALDDEGDACQALAARIATEPPKMPGEEPEAAALQAAQDLVSRLWRRHLERRRAEMGRRMQSLEGEERQALLHEMTELLLDIGKLKRGWETAQPIIAHHLERMVEA